MPDFLHGSAADLTDAPTGMIYIETTSGANVQAVYVLNCNRNTSALQNSTVMISYNQSGKRSSHRILMSTRPVFVSPGLVGSHSLSLTL